MANFKTTSVDDLKAMLHEGIVNFEFIKRDGSVRSAKGTLRKEYLPASTANANATSRKKNNNVLVYFDLDKNAFRSMAKEGFVGAY